MIADESAALRREAALDTVVQSAIAVPSTVHRVAVRGAAIHYRRWGATDAPGRPVILAHGMLAHSYWWDPIAALLSVDRPVVAMDFSGLGDSDRREQYGRELHADEIVGVAKDAGFEQPLLVAHSYGGDPAVRAALANPDRFHRLVIVDSRLPLPGIPPLGLPGQLPQLVRKTYPSYEAAYARFRLTPDSGLSHPLLLAHVARNSICQEGEQWTWKFDAATVGNALADRQLDPTGLVTPTIFINGAQSELTGPQQIAMSRKWFPNAPILTVPAAGHHVLLDQPLVLAALLEGILATG